MPIDLIFGRRVFHEKIGHWISGALRPAPSGSRRRTPCPFENTPTIFQTPTSARPNTAARQARVASAAKRQSRVERAGYNVSEFSASLGVDDSTTHRWIAKGIVSAVKIAGPTIITAAERDRLLREGAPSGRGRQARAPGGRFVKEAKPAPEPVKAAASSKTCDPWSRNRPPAVRPGGGDRRKAIGERQRASHIPPSPHRKARASLARIERSPIGRLAGQGPFERMAGPPHSAS